MESEQTEEVKQTKKLGRPIRYEYSFTDPHKSKLIKDYQQYPGQHQNRIIRYKGEEYKFCTLQQIMNEFNMSYCVANKLLSTHIKKSKNIELSKYETKLLKAYSDISIFEKLPINKKIKVIGFISPTTDTSMSLKIDVPSK